MKSIEVDEELAVLANGIVDDDGDPVPGITSVVGTTSDDTVVQVVETGNPDEPVVFQAAGVFGIADVSLVVEFTQNDANGTPQSGSVTYTGQIAVGLSAPVGGEIPFGETRKKA